jgi:TnpA family transposase
MHALRNFLFVANERQIRKRDHEDQFNQDACLNLLTNVVAVWNTVYTQAVLEQLKIAGYEINEDDVEHLSSARS